MDDNDKSKLRMIPGYEGYYTITPEAVIYNSSWHRMKPRLAAGRPIVNLQKKGVITGHYVCDLMVKTFKLDIPGKEDNCSLEDFMAMGFKICYIDGDPTNCALSNLYWGIPNDYKINIAIEQAEVAVEHFKSVLQRNKEELRLARQRLRQLKN